MKTLLINIQIDDFKLSELEELEQELNDVLSQYKRRNVQISVSNTFGPPLPIVDNE